MITTGPRSTQISATTIGRRVNESKLCFEWMRTESDNHADTHCFGSNFRPIAWKDLQCTVSPFVDDLGSSNKVEICTGATAWDTPEGETVILVFGQGLWFGERMKDKSLINPNQCRAFGISFCDDPSDPYRQLGMYDPKSDLNIPMSMNGSFCSFRTRCPTKKELENCTWITLSSEDDWDPLSSPFAQESRNVNSYKSTYQEREETEFDILLNSISSGFSEHEIFKRTIEAVQIREVSSINKEAKEGFKDRKEYLPEKAYIKPTPYRTTIERSDSQLTTERHHSITPESLSRKWHIGLNRARKTLKVTTQAGIRSALHPLTRRYRTDLMQSKYRRLNCTFYTDTMFATTKSLEQNTCCQVWTDGHGYVFADPLRSKKETHLSLDRLVETVGIPNKIFSDGAPEEVGLRSKFVSRLRELHIRSHQSEPYSQWQNRAENTIGKLKARWKRRMARRRVPKKLWDFGLVYESEIMSRMASGHDGRTAFERITGDTCDISEWADFEFYDLVWYWDTPFTEDNPKIGRWLGVSHRVGSALCYWILTDKGKVLARSTVQHLTKEDALQDTVQVSIQAYHVSLHDKLEVEDNVVNNFQGFILNDEDDDPDTVNTEAFDESVKDLDDVLDDNLEDSYDGYINAELQLPDADGNMRLGKVIKRAKGNDGKTIGRSHANPLLDTSEYVVQLPDGSTQEYAANVIAENMFSQIDSEGRRFLILNEICDYSSNHKAVRKENGFTVSHNGRKVPKKTTAGWKLQVEWRDGSTQWVPLKNLKESNPVELAEYAVANNLEEEPAFKWWVQSTLRCRNRIVNKVKSTYWERTHKFGIRLPKTVNEALEIDKSTGTLFWQQAIQKEMKNVRPAFAKWDGTKEDAKKKLVGYQQIRCHMIFEIKMDGKFTRKARFVAGGHTTNPPPSTTYSSVVSRDSVRIAFLVAALNDLDIWAADIGNAYLNAPCREKIWTMAGAEFGSEQGSVMTVVRALYGLKTSGASWRAMFAETLKDMGFVSTKADPDVYIKPATKDCGFEYYEMILVYVDDVLHCSHDITKVEKHLKGAYRLKDGSAGEPDRYLGANIRKYVIDGDIRYALTCEDYVKSAINNVEKMLLEDGQDKGLAIYGKKSASRPFPINYRAECDVSNELTPNMASRYLQLIGILRWAVELGRIDIYTEVSVLSQHQCLPREGHLDAAYRIFWYLKKAKPSRIIFDPSTIDTDQQLFPEVDKEAWRDFYEYAEEPMPPTMPTPRGLGVKVSCYVDADHAANRVTRRSHSGIIIYCQNTPIIWFSKRQNTVETSSFGSEFVALRIATELIQALRYKLRMFGIPVEGPADIFCDNQSVTKNASIPTSVLSKKHNAICYHKVREAQASGAQRVAWIQGEYNQADILTKTTLSTDVKANICHEIFGWRRKDIFLYEKEEKTSKDDVK
jgi:hypothetical protein